MNTKQKDEPVQTSTQKTPVSGGSFDENQKKRRRMVKIVVVAVLLAGVLAVYFLFFNQKPYSDVTDPRPDLLTADLTKEESDQRLQSRFGFSIDDVKNKGIDTRRIESLPNSIAIAQILKKHELYDEAVKVFEYGEKIGKAEEKNAEFYTNYYTAAYDAKDKELLEKLFQKRKEILNSQAEVDTETIKYNIDKMQREHAFYLNQLNTGGAGR